MSEPIFKPRLPVFGAKDGDQVITSSGNIFEYNAEENQWVCIGIIPKTDIVTQDSNGLVPPDIYRKLTLIQELIDQGFDFSNFKLDSDVNNPYFYYFHSSDDLIRFTPERCTNPKEVKLSASVTGVDEFDTYSIISLDMQGVSDFSGLILETSFGDYSIDSNEENRIRVNANDINILVGDRVKIVKPESVVVKLRIEIDKGRLYQKLVRNCCVGPKGVKGDKGDTGSPGIPADDEVFQLPVDITGGVFKWDAKVETPIDTPISLRIFDGVIPIIEVLYPLDNSSQMIIISDDNIVIEETSFESYYDLDSSRFTGSFFVAQGGDNIGSWRYKVRQRGAKGPSGDDGKVFLEVTTQLLDDPSIRSTEAIVSMRKGSVDGDIILFRNTLFDEVPVSNLTAVVADPIVDILDDRLVTVNVTIDESKDIGFYRFSPKSFDVPPLDIPLWTPTSDCVQSRRWAQYRFDWFNKTDPDYLFSILLNPKPDEQCCQEDFFYCPNVGDGPCGIQGEISPPVPTPMDCLCECENPIASELSAGGLTLTPIDLTSEISVAQREVNGELSGVSKDFNQIDIVGDGGTDNLLPQNNIQSIQVNSVESIIDGIVNNFRQNIKLVGNGEIIISLDYDSSPCNGPMMERQSCAFVDSNAVRSFINLVDKSGTSVISSGGVLETKAIPITVAFTVTGAQRELSAIAPDAEPGQKYVVLESGKEFDVADLELNISINVTNVEYCRGYRLTITALSDESFETLGKGKGGKKKEPIITKVPVEEGIPLEEEKPVTVIPPGDGIPPPVIIPDTSFAGDGKIIKGGMIVDQVEPALVLLDHSNYVLEFGSDLFNTSGTGVNQIFSNFETGIGRLIASPGNSLVPLIHDGAQDNILLTVPNIILSKFDAGFDKDGPLGVGTYIRILDFGTLISSRIPNVGIRQDLWTDCVGFMSAPQNPGDVFNFIITGRLRSSELLDTASSTFFDSMFNSGAGDAVIIYNGVYNEDPMTAIKNGSIVFGGNGKFTIGYLGNDEADLIYPEVLIGIEGPPEEVIPGSGLTNLEVNFANVIVGGSGDVIITFDTDSLIPIDGQIWVQFPIGFDLSNVSFIDGNLDGGVTVVTDGSFVKIVRLGDGGVIPSGMISITIGGVVNSIVADSYLIEVSTRQFSGSVINGPEESMITITTGVPDVINSTINANPSSGALANGSDLVTITVTVKDVNGSPLSGSSVVVSSSEPTDVIADAIVVTDANGVAATTVTATVPGPRTFSATADSLMIVDTAVVTYLSGVPSDSLSTVTVSPSTIVANGVDSALVEVTVLDTLGAPVVGATVEIFATGSNNIITQPVSPTNALGVASGSIATTTSQVITVTAEVNGSLSLTDSASISSTAGPPSDANSMVVASPTSGLIANGSDVSTITVTIYDANNNPVQGEAVSVSATGGGTVLSPVNGSTDSFGVFTSSLTATSDGSKTVLADLPSSIGTLSDTASVFFEPFIAPSVTLDSVTPTTAGSLFPTETNLKNVRYSFSATIAGFSLPADGIIKITLPAGFDPSNVVTSGSIALDGSFSVSVAGQVVTITRFGGTAFSPGSFDILIGDGVPGVTGNGVTNPSSPTFADNFSIELFDGASNSLAASATGGSLSIIETTLSFECFFVPGGTTKFTGSPIPYDPTGSVDFSGSAPNLVTLAGPDLCIYEHWHEFGSGVDSFDGTTLSPEPYLNCGFGAKISGGVITPTSAPQKPLPFSDSVLNEEGPLEEAIVEVTAGDYANWKAEPAGGKTAIPFTVL